MRISDWSSDVCSSDLVWSYEVGAKKASGDGRANVQASAFLIDWNNIQQTVPLTRCGFAYTANLGKARSKGFDLQLAVEPLDGLILRGSVAYTDAKYTRSEEHTSELQSLMRISYAVFCLKKKKNT